MNLEFAIQLTQRIFSASLFLFGLEFYFLGQNKSFLKIWSYTNLKSDLLAGLPLPTAITEILFSEKSLKFLGLIQMICAGFYFTNGSTEILVVLFLIQLINTIRFRGTFNGGSDMMIFVILTGLLIAAANQKMGLIYLAIHAGYSYIKSGYSKLIQPEWRDGSALAAFLERSQIVFVRHQAPLLKSKTQLNLLLCWFVILFELSIVLLPVFPKLFGFYLGGIIMFHLSIYLLFGLNRFFWAWLCAWPAIYFAITN